MSGFFYRAMQRQVLRRAVQTDCQVVTDPHFELVGSEVLDLSTGGAFIRSEIYPRVGERVLMSLRIPRTRMWVDAQGEVTRVVRGRRLTRPTPFSPNRRPTESQGVGIRFCDMDATTRALLQSGLEGLPPPAPQRRLRRDYAKTVRMIGIAPW